MIYNMDLYGLAYASEAPPCRLNGGISNNHDAIIGRHRINRSMGIEISIE
jgi:hypothetical protein